MQKLPTPEMPPYPVGSVDKALRLIHMLRDRGEVRLKTAAQELHVVESTVHRLMAMLVFHGFAMQGADRAYLPGPALGAGPVRGLWIRTVRDIAAPRMDALSLATGETVNLQLRVGTKLHFLWSSEGRRLLRIVSRVGAVIPAVHAAGGRVLLASLPDDVIRRLYQGPTADAEGAALSDDELDDLLRSLRRLRRNGFATANGETEIGVAAIAVPIRDELDRSIAALAIAIPTARYAELFENEILRSLTDARDEIERDLNAAALDQ